MNEEIRQAAIALHDRFTHEERQADYSPGAISDCRGPSDLPLDRRLFMAELTRIAGSAAAASALLAGIGANPAAAAVVPEDDKRLSAEEIEWPVAGGRRMKGYQAEPAQRTDRPLVLVIHENRGLNEHIRDVARRVALAGYAAVAPDFLSSAGGTPADQDQARTMIGKLDLAESVADAVASLDWFRSRSPGERRRIGALGFCWGGAMVNRLAVGAGDELDAGVVFYGPGPSPAEASRVQAPLLIHLAEKDSRVNETALPWVLALRNAGRQVRAINYHGVNHAFHNDTSAERYDAKAAARAWATTLAFFKQHLG